MMRNVAEMSAADLRLHLPFSPQAATQPPERRGVRRDEVKMMVLHRQTETFHHTQFHHLADYLGPGDVLVVNRSTMIPARLRAVLKDTSEPLILHLASRLNSREIIFERRHSDGSADTRPFSIGAKLVVQDPVGQPAATLTVGAKFHVNSRFWHGSCHHDLFELCQEIGEPVRYSYVADPEAIESYRTIFGCIPGSAEMPSASRPFTKPVLRTLAAKGVQICSITLHTGLSSHEVESTLANHPVLPEYYEVPAATVRTVNEARRQGRRVIAVGTTVVRALESAVEHDRAQLLHRSRPDANVFAQEGSRLRPVAGAWTTHLVTPETPPQIVTGLFTGMHESMSSHLALIYAFIHPKLVEQMYSEAVSQGYLWHEFGDTHLIL